MTWAGGLGLIGGGLAGAVLLPRWALDESGGGGGSGPVVSFGTLFGLVVGAAFGSLIALPTAVAIIVAGQRTRVGPTLRTAAGAKTAIDRRDGADLHPQDW